MPLTQEDSELAINCFEGKIDFGEAIANLVKMYAPKSMVRQRMGRNYRHEYEYDVRHCFPGSNVLKNKLNITDKDILEEAERRRISLRTAEVMKKGIRGKFNFNHLKRIHKFLFGDIYD